MGIAQFGYSEKFQYAFFPLYPLLIKGVNLILQNYLLSGVLISILSAFFALHLLYKLVADDFDKKVAEKVILLLLFFPTSFYFLTVYSEGLFLLMVVAAFYFLRQKRLLLATGLAALASATRLSGLAIVAALVVEVLLKEGLNRKNWYIMLSPLGFIIYSWYLWGQTGDPFYFISAQSYWHNFISLPGLNFFWTLGSLTPNKFLDLVFAAFGLGMAMRAVRFLPLPYSVYAFVSLLIPLFTASLTSMPRFLSVVFPIFILLALMKNKYLILTYQMICLMLLSLFIVLFVNGYWIS